MRNLGEQNSEQLFLHKGNTQVVQTSAQSRSSDQQQKSNEQQSTAQQPTPYSTYISNVVTKQKNGKFSIATHQTLSHSQEKVPSTQTRTINDNINAVQWRNIQAQSYNTTPVFMVAIAGVDPVYFIDHQYVLRCHLSSQEVRRINTEVLQCLGQDNNIVSPRGYQVPYPIEGGRLQYNLKVVRCPFHGDYEDVLLINTGGKRVPYLADIFRVSDLPLLNSHLKNCCEFSKKAEQQLTTGHYCNMSKLHVAMDKLTNLSCDQINDGMQQIISTDIIQTYGKALSLHLILGLFFALRNANVSISCKNSFQKDDLIVHINGLINLVIFTPFLQLFEMKNMPFVQNIVQYKNAWINPATFISNAFVIGQ
jgi:hypothetical protein